MNDLKFLTCEGSEEKSRLLWDLWPHEIMCAKMQPRGLRISAEERAESGVNEVQQLRAGEATQPQGAPAEPPSWLEVLLTLFPVAFFLHCIRISFDAS